jgi:hypothetical protein
MADQRSSPRTRHGGLVVVDGHSGEVCHAVRFQYNPDGLVHRLEAPLDVVDGDVRAGPLETVMLATELDATDDLESGDRLAAELGIAHRIAAFHALLKPPVPCAEPVVVLAFGPSRTMPVHIAELSVSEDAYDQRLNPIRATVSLTLVALDAHAVPAGAARTLQLHEAEQARLARLGAGAPPAGFGA